MVLFKQQIVTEHLPFPLNPAIILSLGRRGISLSSLVSQGVCTGTPGLKCSFAMSSYWLGPASLLDLSSYVTFSWRLSLAVQSKVLALLSTVSPYFVYFRALLTLWNCLVQSLIFCLSTLEYWPHQSRTCHVLFTVPFPGPGTIPGTRLMLNKCLVEEWMTQKKVNGDNILTTSNKSFWSPLAGFIGRWLIYWWGIALMGLRRAAPSKTFVVPNY